MFKRIKILLVILFLYFMFVQQPAYVSGVNGCKECYKKCQRQHERDMKLCDKIKPSSPGYQYCVMAAENALQQCQVNCETDYPDCDEGGGGGGPDVICWPQSDGSYRCVSAY
jgi:hypothetical protein